MATKAELIAELAELKARLAESEARAEPVQGMAHDIADASPIWANLLTAHGMDPAEVEALWARVSAELERLPQKQPILLALAAFGLGFVLGRATK